MATSGTPFSVRDRTALRASDAQPPRSSAAAIYFAIQSPGFRKAAAFVLSVFVLLGVAGAAYLYWNSQREAAQSMYAETLIKSGEVDFIDLKWAASSRRK